MYQRLQTDEAKTRLVRRSTTVEPVFGNLKQNLGFRRFNLKGSQQVKGEFNLMCIAHNLNILFALLAKEFFSLFFKVFHALYTSAKKSISKNQYKYRYSITTQVESINWLQSH